MGQKNNLKFLVVILIFLFSVTFIVAQVVPASTTEVDWYNEDQFYDNFASDPYSAFEYNQDMAWSAMYNDPNIMATNPDAMLAAFENNPAQAITVINDNIENNNVNVLQKEYINSDGETIINENYDLLTENFELSIIDDISLLEGNPEAQKAWLENYGVSDEGSTISSYDGTTMVTEGEFGSTFNILAVDGATILEDGRLVLSSGLEVSSSDEIDFKKDELGDYVYEDGQQVLVISGGTVDGSNVEISEIGKIEFTDAILQLDDVTYQGDFIYQENDKGISISSMEGYVDRYTNKPYVKQCSFKGTIIDPETGNYKSLILKGNVELKTNYATLNVEGDEDTEVYYIQTLYRSNGEHFCQDEYSCIIDVTRNSIYNEEFRHELIFDHVKNNDGITFSSNVYYSKVEVNDLDSGYVNYISLSDSGSIESKIVVKKNGEIHVFGDLKETNSGRFDVEYYTEESCAADGCSRKKHHFSTDEHLKSDVADYFSEGLIDKALSSFDGTDSEEVGFVTCTQGVDCERKFAESFGQVIGVPEGSNARTTIIITGDNPTSAEALEDWCEINGGCYIMNSRDMPETTSSEKLVVTGHHFGGDEYTDEIWRDPDSAVKGTHTPIDVIEYSDFPSGDVTGLYFSACNTVVPLSRDDALEPVLGLFYKYENLEVVQGTTGAAPLVEKFKGNNPLTSGEINLPDNLEEIKDLQFSTGDPRMPNHRAWYYKTDDTLYYTTDGHQSSLDKKENQIELSPALADADI